MTNPEKPIMMTTIGGIVTVNGGHKHPSFMVIDLDAKTLLPVNMYTYYMNLDEANETGTPVWRVLHDYLEEYSLPDMSPASMRDLAIRILTNHELSLKFENNLDRRTDHFVRKTNQLANYCSLITSEDYEYHECKKTAGLSAYGVGPRLLHRGEIGNYIRDWLMGNWVKFSQN